MSEAYSEKWTSDDGSVVLYAGNCLSVLPTIADGSVEMVWTDPPYGHNNNNGDWLSRRHEIMEDGNASIQQAIANDDADGMRNVVDGMLREAVRILDRDCCCCCCCCCCGGGPSPTFAWVAQRMDRDGLQFFHSVIWDKLNPGVGWRYRRQHEMVMVAHRRGGKLLWGSEDRKQPNIIRLSKPRTNYHPNEKPEKLVEKFVLNHTIEGNTICDPFMGSGTTGVVAARLGRKFIGIELDPAYFAIAKARIQRELDTKKRCPMLPGMELANAGE
jgi:site-specific DNA-methyltransferase (adenine-specific)